MTNYSVIYDAFLAKILEDEWADWQMADIEADWRQILDAALPWFKFPRVSLEKNALGFVSDLSNEEIQIIANYMKCEWLNRSILTWENIKPMYEERDFSQANLLDKLHQMLANERANAAALEAVYYRSRNGKPFHYSSLGGK